MKNVLSLEEFKALMSAGAQRVKDNVDMLTKIDGRFGDGDHGITMGKVAAAIIAGAEGSSIGEYCDALGMEMMCINGGSASSLWGTLFMGFASAETGAEIDAEGFKRLLAGGVAELCGVSTARVGDKTMMDALIPAAEAAERAEPELEAVLRAASDAAAAGREKSRGMVARFGRAKSYGEETIGTPDAGAVSAALFLEGLLDGYLKLK